MSEYKTIPVKPELFDELKDDKDDGVTWEYYIRQLYQTSDYPNQ